MRLSVVVMFEKGRPRDREAIIGTAPSCGDLRVEWRNDATRNRAIRVARLLDSGDASEDMLPPLEGAELVGMSGVAFTLSGVEHSNGAYFAQSWLVRQAPAERAIDPGGMHPATRRRLAV
jgi:hypothetical protein